MDGQMVANWDERWADLSAAHLVECSAAMTAEITDSQTVAHSVIHSVELMVAGTDICSADLMVALMAVCLADPTDDMSAGD
jgi:hypothetical protein